MLEERMPNVTLQFSMQKQGQTQWCWAAVAVSTAAFYSGRTPHTQCAVVNAVLHATTCCAAGDSPQCDVPDSLKDALMHVGHLQQTVNGAATWAAIDRELQANQPVGVLIRLIGGGGHFLAISGNGTPANQAITVEDPYQGKSVTKWKLLQKSVHGQWFETYFTQPLKSHRSS